MLKSNYLFIKICKLNYQSKRLINKRITINAVNKMKRSLKAVQLKSRSLENVNIEPKFKMHKDISRSIQIIEGKDIIRKKKEILNQTYLQSISELISLHSNYEQLPKLNINSVEINDRLLHVKIFWSFTENDPDKIKIYHRLLNEMIPEIRKNLKSNYYINTAPEITFIYDALDGFNNEMENLYLKIKEQTIKIDKEPFDPFKYFEKEKLIKKEFDIRSVVLRDPSVDFKRDEQLPIKFKYPYEMNLFMFNLDFKKMYETILFKLSQGKMKRNLNKINDNLNETRPSPYIEPSIFKHSDLEKEKYDLPLTDDRLSLMKQFIILNKKKIQRESREMMKENLERLDDELEEKLEIKKRMSINYDDEIYFENK